MCPSRSLVPDINLNDPGSSSTDHPANAGPTQPAADVSLIVTMLVPTEVDLADAVGSMLEQCSQLTRRNAIAATRRRIRQVGGCRRCAHVDMRLDVGLTADIYMGEDETR